MGSGPANSFAPAPRPRARNVMRLRIDWWATGLLYLALVVVHLDLALTMSGPVVYSDEGGYMGIAHLLASGKGLLYLGAPYHPGYSLLLVPLVRVFTDPMRSYHASLILNSLLLAAVGSAIFWLTRWFVARDALLVRLAVAGVVAAYPAFLVYSNLIVSMNLFIPLFVGLCIATGVALDRGHPLAWALVGALAGGLYVVHPLGLVVIAALALFLLVVPAPGPRRLIALGATAAGVLGVLVPGALLINHVDRSTQALAGVTRAAPTATTKPAVVTTVTRPRSPTPTTVPPSTTPTIVQRNRTTVTVGELRQNASLSHLGSDLAELAGQVLYLAVGTLGLWVIGMVVGLGAAWRTIVRREQTGGDRLATFAVLVMLVTLAVSTVRFNTLPGQVGAADELIYGRYNELVLAPISMLGLVALTRLRSRSWSQILDWPVVVGLVLAAAGVGLIAGRSHASLRQVFVDVNVLALHPLLTWFGGINVVGIVLCGLAAIVAVTVLAKAGGVALAAVPMIAVCVLSASFSANRLSRDSDGRADERVVINAIHLLATRFGAKTDCVAYDIPIEHVWHLANDQFFLPTVRFRRFDSTTAQRPCSDLVLSGRLDLEKQYPGARLMTPENFSSTNLWILPGPLQSKLRAAGDLLPDGFPTALPAAACHSTIALVGVGKGARLLPYAGQRNLVLSVRHDGTGSPWPSRLGFYAGDGWVRLAVVWVAQSNPLVPVAEGSVDLPHTVYPGQTVDVTLHLAPIGLDGKPLPPGAYVVRVGLVQDGFTFFTDKGDHTLDLGLTVGTPAGSRLGG